MNDPTEPSIPTLPPEELASAYLDGELSDESRRSVEADPQLLAMVDAFASARSAVAAPVTGLSEHDRDDLVATAVAALPAGSVPGATPDTTSADSAGADTAGAGALVPPAPTRISSARQARSRRMVQITAGALAAVAAAGILALVISRDDSGDSTTARSSDSTAGATAEADAQAGSGTFEQAGDSSATTAGAAAAVPGATATDGPTGDAAGSVAPGATESLAGALAALPDLGPLANRNEVIAAARPFATSRPAETPVVSAGYPAPLATATFQGTPAYLVVIEASAAGNRMALVGMDTCTVLVKVDLAAS